MNTGQFLNIGMYSVVHATRTCEISYGGGNRTF